MDMHYTIEGLCHLNTSQNVKQIDKNRWWSLVFLMWLSFLLEIVDGNPKMTLGMIWTIILRFAIQDITVEGVYWSEITLDLRTRIERKR